MLFAKVAVGLPIEDTFDYSIPESYQNKIEIGMRCWINFCHRRCIGYIVEISGKSDISINKIKPIISLIDDEPILNPSLLLLGKKVAEYYCCSWGEAIETTLPEELRKGKIISVPKRQDQVKAPNKFERIIIEDREGFGRFKVFADIIQKTLAQEQSVIVVVPDTYSIEEFKQFMPVFLQTQIISLYRNQPKEIEIWQKIYKAKTSFVVGTRSAIFAPVSNLGLIIVDQESDPGHKQDQVPHYHSRTVSLMRGQIENCKVILASRVLSLEARLMTKTRQTQVEEIPPNRLGPEINIIDMKKLPVVSKRHTLIISRVIQDEIVFSLTQKRKILLLIPRQGFANSVICSNCKQSLKCQRCATNLAYFLSTKSVKCRYCNFSQELPKICPSCKAGYLKLKGLGVERVESEFARLFPSAKIERFNRRNLDKCKQADMVIAGQDIFHFPFCFDISICIGIDNLFTRIDFRAAEQTMRLLLMVVQSTKDKVFIQTNFAHYEIFSALKEKNPLKFYKKELKIRRQLQFPPLQHFVMVKLRGKNESKVKTQAEKLFNLLSQSLPTKQVNLLSLTAGQPPKLRGNFYWVILLSCKDPIKISCWLRKKILQFTTSGITKTIDVDPE
ncbi:MAG: primosomal protein N' [Candidatus Omnitrophica bacterium]|nr:primosomal protein N' [Candidatus Omnitrophota bacterium]